MKNALCAGATGWRLRQEGPSEQCEINVQERKEKKSLNRCFDQN